MSEPNINQVVGERIKIFRKQAKMTQKEVADKYAILSGEYVSANMISMWEHGKRKIYAYQYYYLCNVLGRPSIPISMEGYKHIELEYDIKQLSSEELNILKYVFNHWDGNTHALIQFIGLYASLPKKLRQDIAGMGCHMYKIGLREHKLVENAPDIDFDYIEEQTSNLWNWKQNEL